MPVVFLFARRKRIPGVREVKERTKLALDIEADVSSFPTYLFLSV